MVANPAIEITSSASTTPSTVRLHSRIGSIPFVAVQLKLIEVEVVLYSSEGKFNATDGFVVSISTEDPKFDTKSTKGFLESIGGQNLEEI